MDQVRFPVIAQHQQIHFTGKPRKAKKADTSCNGDEVSHSANVDTLHRELPQTINRIISTPDSDESDDGEWNNPAPEIVPFKPSLKMDPLERVAQLFRDIDSKVLTSGEILAKPIYDVVDTMPDDLLLLHKHGKLSATRIVEKALAAHRLYPSIQGDVLNRLTAQPQPHTRAEHRFFQLGEKEDRAIFSLAFLAEIPRARRAAKLDIHDLITVEESEVPNTVRETLGREFANGMAYFGYNLHTVHPGDVSKRYRALGLEVWRLIKIDHQLKTAADVAEKLIIAERLQQAELRKAQTAKNGEKVTSQKADDDDDDITSKKSKKIKPVDLDDVDELDEDAEEGEEEDSQKTGRGEERPEKSYTYTSFRHNLARDARWGKVGRPAEPLPVIDFPEPVTGEEDPTWTRQSPMAFLLGLNVSLNTPMMPSDDPELDAAYAKIRARLLAPPPKQAGALDKLDLEGEGVRSHSARARISHSHDLSPHNEDSPFYDLKSDEPITPHDLALATLLLGEPSSERQRRMAKKLDRAFRETLFSKSEFVARLKVFHAEASPLFVEQKKSGFSGLKPVQLVQWAKAARLQLPFFNIDKQLPTEARIQSLMATMAVLGENTADSRKRFASAIKQWLKVTHEPIANIAKILGHGPTWVHTFSIGKAPLKAFDLEKIAHFFEITPRHILTPPDLPAKVKTTKVTIVRVPRALKMPKVPRVVHPPRDPSVPRSQRAPKTFLIKSFGEPTPLGCQWLDDTPIDSPITLREQAMASLIIGEATEARRAALAEKLQASITDSGLGRQFIGQLKKIFPNVSSGFITKRTQGIFAITSFDLMRWARVTHLKLDYFKIDSDMPTEESITRRTEAFGVLGDDSPRQRRLIVDAIEKRLSPQPQQTLLRHLEHTYLWLSTLKKGRTALTPLEVEKVSQFFDCQPGKLLDLTFKPIKPQAYSGRTYTRKVTFVRVIPEIRTDHTFYDPHADEPITATDLEQAQSIIGDGSLKRRMALAKKLQSSQEECGLGRNFYAAYKLRVPELTANFFYPRRSGDLNMSPQHLVLWAKTAHFKLSYFNIDDIVRQMPNPVRVTRPELPPPSIRNAGHPSYDKNADLPVSNHDLAIASLLIGRDEPTRRRAMAKRLADAEAVSGLIPAEFLRRFRLFHPTMSSILIDDKKRATTVSPLQLVQWAKAARIKLEFFNIDGKIPSEEAVLLREEAFQVLGNDSKTRRKEVAESIARWVEHKDKRWDEMLIVLGRKGSGKQLFHSMEEGKVAFSAQEIVFIAHYLGCRPIQLFDKPTELRQLTSPFVTASVPSTNKPVGALPTVKLLPALPFVAAPPEKELALAAWMIRDVPQQALAEKLRHLRQQSGASLQTLSERCGFRSAFDVENMENGIVALEPLSIYRWVRACGTASIPSVWLDNPPSESNLSKTIAATRLVGPTRQVKLIERISDVIKIRRTDKAQVAKQLGLSLELFKKRYDDPSQVTLAVDLVKLSVALNIPVRVFDINGPSV